MRSCTIPIFVQLRESLDRPSKPFPANGAPLSCGSEPACRTRASLPRRQQRPGSGPCVNCLASDEVTAVCVGDRKRITPGAITRAEVALEIHAPKLIWCGDLRERLRARSRPALLLLGIS